MVAAAVLLGGFDCQDDLVGEVALIVPAFERGSDVFQGLSLGVPTERDRLDLYRIPSAAVFLDDGKLLSAVRTGRIVEEPVVAKFKACAAPLCDFGELSGQFFGGLSRADAPTPVTVQHQLPPSASRRL